MITAEMRANAEHVAMTDIERRLQTRKARPSPVQIASRERLARWVERHK